MPDGWNTNKERMMKKNESVELLIAGLQALVGKQNERIKSAETEIKMAEKLLKDYNTAIEVLRGNMTIETIVANDATKMEKTKRSTKVRRRRRGSMEKRTLSLFKNKSTVLTSQDVEKALGINITYARHLTSKLYRENKLFRIEPNRYRLL